MFMELIFANIIILPFCTVLFIILQILFLRISQNHEKSESYWPRKFLAIRYMLLAPFPPLSKSYLYTPDKASLTGVYLIKIYTYQ